MLLLKGQGDHQSAILQWELAYALGGALVEAKGKIINLEEKNRALESENARLKEQLQLAKQRHFGQKKESGDSAAVVEATEPELEAIAGYVRKKKVKSCGRVLDTSQLPRFTIWHDLQAEEKYCTDCQGPLHLIGKETSEQLELLPQRFYVAEHVRCKYGCRQCQTLKMAPKAPGPIAKSLAGSSVLTEVIVNKYHHHLPLYRQSKIIESYGLLIPDNTLANWVSQVGDGLMVLYEALWEAIRESGYLQVDETPVKVQKPDKKGYLWCYHAPGSGLVVFEMSLTRSGFVVETRLADFKGLLQSDGYAGYQGMRQKRDVAGLGCFTHARRKFVDVFKISKDPHGIAAQAIAKLQPLYDLERRMREQGITEPRIRKRLRQKIAWPIVKDFLHWLKQVRPKVAPKSQLASAINYTFNQWPYLIAYLRHGTAEIDTNWVENQIRPVALGRKNWLFIGNENSGKTHALFYSLLASAVLNGLNPRLYLHYLITQIHPLRLKQVTPLSLLPHNIDTALLKHFAQHTLEQGRKVLSTV